MPRLTHRIHTEIAAKTGAACWAFVAFVPDGCAVHGVSGFAKSSERADAELETVVHAVTWAVQSGTSGAIYTSYFPLINAAPERLNLLLKRIPEDRNVSIALLACEGRNGVIGASAAHRAAKSALDRFLRPQDASMAAWEYPLNKVRRIPAA